MCGAALLMWAAPGDLVVGRAKEGDAVYDDGVVCAHAQCQPPMSRCSKQGACLLQLRRCSACTLQKHGRLLL